MAATSRPHRRWSRPAACTAVLLLGCGAVTWGQVYSDVGPSVGVVVPANPAAAFGRGACFGDFDGDGDQDLVATGGLGQPILHFRNDGAAGFADLSGTSGLGNAGFSRGLYAADVDNDGDLDLYLCRSWEPNALFLNDGSGTFTDQAAAAGVDHPGGSYGAAFADFDRDGFVDLFIANHTALAGGPESDVLYRNAGDGTFTDVGSSAGIGGAGLGFSAVWHDPDEDGWPDLFVANDRGALVGTDTDLTWHNQGDGTFTDVSVALNTAFGIDGMGVDVVDAFNDGGWDLFVTNTAGVGHLFHVWNPQTGQYDEMAAALGLQMNGVGWACHFFDYDNDGWQDLHVVHNGVTPNRLFRNPQAAAPWIEVGTALGLGLVGEGYVAAVADYDDDGMLEIFQPRPNAASVLLKSAVSAGGWIKVALVGTRSNRSGIGAVISVTTGGITQRQIVRSGTGYLAGSDLRCHFGLGLASVVDAVRIQWPSGQDQRLLAVSPGQVLTVVEPDLALDAPLSLGTTPTLTLTAPGEIGLPFQLILSGSASPGIPLPDGRVIPVTLDPLALACLIPGNPILPGGTGILSSGGVGSSPLPIPAEPALVGLGCIATAVTGDPAWPSGLRTVIPALDLTIVP